MDEDVVFRAAQIAQKVSLLESKMSLYRRFGTVRKEKAMDLKALKIEYKMLLDIIRACKEPA